MNVFVSFPVVGVSGAIATVMFAFVIVALVASVPLIRIIYKHKLY